MEPRHAAALIIERVISRQQSLDKAGPTLLQQIPSAKQRSLTQELAFGVLRWHLRLQSILNLLLQRPLRRKDADIQALLLIGLYQIIYLRVPNYAAVAATVTAAKELGKPWATGLVNGVLRNYLRATEKLEQRAEQDESARYAHPAWIIDAIRQHWPHDWQQIMEQNNQHAPMVLRVNARKTSRKDYLRQLEALGNKAFATPFATHGIRLETAVDTQMLPGFKEGFVSVQDAAAQLAAKLLDLKPHQRVLDTCAAPGGKTAHLLEWQPALKDLMAVELNPARARLLEDTLTRLALEARIVTADASNPNDWWDNQPFDRILLDAPCSATGVIRRHPDIKHLRRRADIEQLTVTQTKLLDALWPLLTPNGKLLYATCSVLAEENQDQIATFLERQHDAQCVHINSPWGHDSGFGHQILPGEHHMDGFFYALLEKKPRKH